MPRINEYLLGEQDMERASYFLFSCSTIGRYIRMAKSQARMSGLHDLVRSGVLSLETTAGRAWHLWGMVLQSQERGSQEIELAVLLVVIAQTADATATRLLNTIALSREPVAAWLGGLARHLSAERAADDDASTAEAGLLLKRESVRIRQGDTEGNVTVSENMPNRYHYA